jgi:hypothetical protein
MGGVDAMSWLQVITKEPLPIDIAPGKKKKRNRPKKFMPTSIALSPDHKEKLKQLGGVRWIRTMLDGA